MLIYSASIRCAAERAEISVQRSACRWREGVELRGYGSSCLWRRRAARIFLLHVTPM